jgi:PAS domain S-box-containing protein
MIPILCVDDASALPEVTKLFMEEGGEFTVDICLSAEDALLRLETASYEAVIAGYPLPGMDGLEFLKVIRTRYPRLPFILFTNKGQEDVAIGALNAGADFYLPKGGEPEHQFAVLKNTVRHLVRKRGEEKALAASPDKYREIVENITDVPCILDTEGIITYISPVVSRFGSDPGDVTGRPFMDLVVVEDRSDTGTWLAAIREGRPEPGMFRIRSKEGISIRVRCSGSPLPGKGQAAGILVLMTDITIEKEMEDALKASEGHYRGIVDNAPMGIFHATPEGELVEVNAAFARIFGYDSPEESSAAINRQGGTAMLSVEPEKAVDWIRQVTECGAWQSIETRWRKKDGSAFTALVTFSLYENPIGRRELVGFVTDVTGSREAEARVAAREEQYRTIFESAGDAILVTDRESGEILDANSTALALYQYTRDEFRALKYADLDAGHPPSDEQSALSGEPGAENYHRKKDGTVFPVEVTARTSPWGKRKICISSIRDITGRVDAGERILASRRLYVMQARINEAIVRVRDLETLLRAICRIAVESGQFRMVWVGLVDKEQAIIRPVASAGLEDGYLNGIHIPLDTAPGGSGLTGSAFRSGDPTIITDIATDPSMDPGRDEALRRGYRSAAAFPFRLHGEVVGVLNLYAAEPGFFSDTVAGLLRETTEDLSFALGVLDEQARRARAEQSLAGFEERARFLAAILGQSPQPFFVGYPDGRFGMTNKAFCDLLGYTEAEMKTLSWNDLTPQESDDTGFQALLEPAGPGIPRCIGMELIRKDNRRLAVEVCSHRFTDSSGNVLNFSSFVTDITERTRVLSESRIARKEWERLFSALPNPVLILDPARTILEASDPVVRLTGTTHEELRTMKCWQVFCGAGSTAPPEGCPCEPMEGSGKPESSPLQVSLPGGTFLVTCSPVTDEAGNLQRVIAVATDITGLTHAELAISESEARYRTIFEHSTDAILLMDGTILDCNPAAERLLGYTRTDIIGHEPAEFSFPVRADGTGSEAAAGDHNLAEGAGRTRFFSWQYRKGDGTLIESDVSLTPVTLPEGRRLIAIIRDVTAKKHAEDAIQKSEAILRLITDSASDMVWLSDLDLVPLYVSPSMVRLRGYTLAELQKLPLNRRLTPESCTIVLGMRDRLVGSKVPGETHPPESLTIELEFCRKDGSTFWSENTFTLIRDDQGRPVRILGVGRDITERLLLENRIRRIASFPELDPEPVIEINLHREILYASPACLSLLKELHMPDNPAAFLPPDTDEIIRSLQASRSPVFCREVTVGDAVFAESLTLSPGGLAVRIYAHDITDLHQAISALARANRKLHRLTGITRHDIRNRLMGVLGYIELAKSSTGDPALLDYLTRSEAAAVGIRHQIEFTKEYENIGSSPPAWQEVSNLIASARTHLDLHGITLVDEVAGASVYADPMFSRVITHLIDNALRHGGSNLSRICFSGSVTSDGYVLACEDDGAGIPGTGKAAIFNRVVGKDTTMGLFLVQEILSLTMIMIRETGEPGKGARFEMTVPPGRYRIVPGPEEVTGNGR